MDGNVELYYYDSQLVVEAVAPGPDGPRRESGQLSLFRVRGRTYTRLETSTS